MQWISLIGSPGTGKSTIIDVYWPPDAITHRGEKPPTEWKPFLDHIKVCLEHMRWHKKYSVGKSLLERSTKKMSTVHHTNSDKVYIQTGFFQRAIGIWYRLKEKDRLPLTTKYLELCPAPLGAITLYADVETIKHRNRTRNKQNRDFMIEDTEECMHLVRKIIKQRNIPLLELDTRNSIQDNRQEILKFETDLRKDI